MSPLNKRARSVDRFTAGASDLRILKVGSSVHETSVTRMLLSVLFLLLIPVGCRSEKDGSREEKSIEHKAHDETEQSDHVDIPETVRRNLGITFAKVERRSVTRTLRMPGRFEFQPQARREYRTMLGGRVELKVAQYQHVEPGTTLYMLDSPAWRELQQRLSDTESSIQRAEARVASVEPLMQAHRRHEENLQVSVEIWTRRLEQLEQSGEPGIISAQEFAQVRAALAVARAELSEVLEKEAELEARNAEMRSELAAARERFQLLLLNASSLVGISREELIGPAGPGMERHAIDTDPDPHRHPYWREMGVVEVKATTSGVVETLALTNGAWASESDIVLSTVQPEMLRFRARGLQSDLGRLHDGLPASIVPPRGGSIPADQTMSGTIMLGVAADADERTVEVLMTPTTVHSWARPGVSAHLEIITNADGREELAIPLAATIHDGIQTIFFRRNPNDSDEVLKVEADLGPDDGRWVVVRSGVREGDEVVVDGAYQLMLATSGGAQKGGHFHADGTFHQEKD
ncbi:MAG: hypothetical protein KF841_11910 [Phycisphaerae bacterium]|nr:hypothetical protein [Phycisphaerae bacterium]